MLSMNYQKVIYLFIILFSAHCIFAQTNSWELRKDSEGIEVYTREVKESNFDEFKGVVYLDASVKTIIDVICNVNEFDKWMPDVEKAKLLKRTGDSIQIDYVETKAPWPVQNRDVIVERHLYHNNSGTVIMEMKALPNYLPEKEGIVRIKKMNGFWKIIPQKNKVKIIYQILTEPGGSIPSWLANLKVVDNPFETLKGLRQMVKTYQNK